MFRLSRLLIPSVVAAFSVWCTISVRTDFAQMSFAPLWSSWALVLLVLTLTFFNYALRASRWRWYLALTRHCVPWDFAVLTYVAGFAFTLSPGKLGELVRARYYNPIGIPLGDVIAAFWAERLMDLLALLLLTLLVLSKFPHYRQLIWVAGIMVAIGAALIITVPFAAIGRRLTLSSRCPTRIAHGVARALQSLATVRSLLAPRAMVGGFLISLAAWGLEGLGLGLLGSIFSPASTDVTTGVGIYAVAVLVGAVSFLPGGLGSTETAMVALLASQGYSLPDALSTTLACRVTTLWLGVGLGWIAVGILQYGRRHEMSIG